MASEPAEPTTRQDLDELILDMVSFWHEQPQTKLLDDVAREYVARWAEAGLLADPEQHTELEQLRTRITRYQEELDKARSQRANAVATSEAWKQERDDLESERDLALWRRARWREDSQAAHKRLDEAQARIDAILKVLPYAEVTAREATALQGDQETDRV